MPEKSALEWGREIEAGRITPRDLAEMFLARIEDAGPGSHIFYHDTTERTRAEADAATERARTGTRLSPLDGVPISWKDLFDTAGIETTAGSKMLEGRVPDLDAVALSRATQAGCVCIGKTAMTELAFSGLGINPVFGTPANAASRNVPLAPGGSSSGAAVSVARGMCAAGIGTDTGGSARIPAAWNGVTGFKPSYGRIPTVGAVPLCPTLDTVGPFTRDVADAAAIFAMLADLPPVEIAGSLEGRRILVPETTVWEATDPGIAEAVEAGLAAMEKAGAQLTRAPVPELDEINRLTWESGISLAAVEAWTIWWRDLETKGDLVYAPVRQRIEGGSGKDAAEVDKALKQRKALRRQMKARLADFDAIAMPTVAIDPPPISELEPGGEAYDRANRMALRNTTIGNQLDWCAISLPCGTSAAGLPVGLMLCAGNGSDENLLSLAAAAEKAIG